MYTGQPTLINSEEGSATGGLKNVWISLEIQGVSKRASEQKGGTNQPGESDLAGAVNKNLILLHFL